MPESETSENKERRGLRIQDAQRKYGVSRTILYRWIEKGLVDVVHPGEHRRGRGLEVNEDQVRERVENLKLEYKRRLGADA